MLGRVIQRELRIAFRSGVEVINMVSDRKSVV